MRLVSWYDNTSFFLLFFFLDVFSFCSFGLNQKNHPDSYRDKAKAMLRCFCRANAHEQYESLKMYLGLK
jgi:hypothetical protein